MPVSSSFIQSCVGKPGQLPIPDDLQGDLMGHLNACVVGEGGGGVSHTFLEQVLGGGGSKSPEVAALVAIASAVAGSSSVSSRTSTMPHLLSWLLRSLARVSFSSISHSAGSANDAAVAAISSLCRHALFETSDVDACGLCLTLLHHWINPPPSIPPLDLVQFLGQPPPPLPLLCALLERASSSLILALSPAVTTFFARFFSVAESPLPHRGLHLLIETLKSSSGDHRPPSSSSTATSGLDYFPVISAIMQPTPLASAPARLAGELCVRWEVKGGFSTSQTRVILGRSAEVAASAAAASVQATASGNSRDAEDARDLQCHAFLVHARCASAGDVKLFESALENFLGFTGTPSPSQLVMTCLAACVVMDSHSTGAAVDTPSPAKSSSPEFSSLLPRDKQFELVSDVIMALLRACPEGIDEGGQGESAADASVAAPIIVRAIAARLALKACRIDMVQCLGGLY